MDQKRTLLTTTLLFIAILAVYSFLNEGRHYIAKNFFDSNEFIQDYLQFQVGLEQYILNEIDVEKVRENLTVSDEEIHNYRTYYGTLAEQIANIKAQYEPENNDGAQDEEVLKALEKERDAKIAEIERNFSDDEYVREKILKAKSQALDNFMKEREEQKAEWQKAFNYFAYEFYDDETNKEFKRGDVNDRAAFKQTFGPNNSIFNSDSVNRTFNFAQYTNFVGAMNNINIPVYEDDKQFTGTITIPKGNLSGTYFADRYTSFKMAQSMHFGLWGLGLLSIILLFTKFKPNLAMFELLPNLRGKFNRLPIDVRIAIWVVLTIVAYSSLYNVTRFINELSHMNLRYFEFTRIGHWLVDFVFMSAATFLVITMALWFIETLKDEDARLKEFPQSFLIKFVRITEEFFYNRSIGTQMLALLVVVFLGGFGLAVVFAMFGAIIIYIPLFFFIFVPVLFIFMRRVGYLNRIMKHTEQLANGRLTSEMKVKGKSPLAQHAQNLNALRDGVRSSMNEQAKSERMKTELITNVSHDLRTPLTSIITYTDLLKNPNITEEERQKYIGILDAKSARLKTLIEDLFEVSKMASGNIELCKQRVDLAQLLQQGAGEHEEDFASAQLDLRIDIGQQPIFAYVDGQKWWRVIDNLIVNALKYSLPGTRVYVSLKVEREEAQFTVKNIAKYELGENATELTERFKRGDASRHTEGSGLGLAIAQSIVDLHDGKMKIEADGDLFKVTVSISTIV